MSTPVTISALSQPALSAGGGCLLALDTATEAVHLAFCSLDAASATHVAVLPGGAQASASALPGLQALLHGAGCAWPDVRAVAFGQGPGAFTGLRTACSLAQGLALALEVPVLPLDTLMALAESARRRDAVLSDWLCDGAHSLWVLQDARMQEVYAAAYGWSAAHGWQLLTPAALWSLDDMQQRIESGQVTHAAGSALAAYPAHVQGLLHHDAQAVPEGAALATLASQAWARGLGVDAALALPVYVRDKVAQTTAERVQARLAAS
jgi:tRNA threonylcarbamoyladenosine biosynthesis protein TsaB